MVVVAIPVEVAGASGMMIIILGTKGLPPPPLSGPLVFVMEGVTVGAAGVMLLEGVEATLVPAEFVAVTMKVYGVPLLNPVMICVNAVLPVFVSVPSDGVEVTVYPVITVPPVFVGALKETVA
jgi:hypothetical protein